MRSVDEPYLIKVDLSSILKSQDSVYTLLVNPAEMMFIFELKKWIQYLFGLKSSISIQHDNSCIHDFENIAILVLLQNPARVKFGGLQLREDDFLKRFLDDEFSSLAPPTKKRLLEEAKRLGGSLDYFVHKSAIESSTPTVVSISERHCTSQGPIEQGNCAEDYFKAAEDNKIDDSLSVEQKRGLKEDKEINGCSVQKLFRIVVNPISSHGLAKEDNNLVNFDKKQFTRKRVKPLSLGTFLNGLRESQNKSHSEESLNDSEATAQENVEAEASEESGLSKPQKRKRVRRHKSKKSRSAICEDASWELPPPIVFPKPSSATQHIRFDDEPAHVNTPGDILPPKESNGMASGSSLLTENIAGEAPDITSTPKTDLQLLFSLKNTYGSAPVFVRDGPTTPTSFCTQ